ncbi:MAG: hypothetical protein PHQ36_07970 [Anaerolineales bacterium]|nr:hypothetical protein [Anaerolineales bacterium]
MKTHIKTKIIKDNSLIIFVVFIVLIILLKWALSFSPASKPVYFVLKSSFVCEKVKDEIRHANIVADRPFDICTQVNSATKDIHRQIRINIYNGKQDFLEPPMYHETIWITNGNIVIHMNTRLSTGFYEIHLTDGKNVLSSLKVKVP